MQAKTVAWFTRVPVAVHMWFADGAGWSYHPDLSEEAFQELVKAVGSYLNSSKSEKFLRTCKGGLLVGEKVPQENCEDPRAINRSPHILRVAFLPQSTRHAFSTGEESEDKRLGQDVLEQLRKVPAPAKREECESLVVWLNRESAHDAPGEDDNLLADKRDADNHDKLSWENMQLKGKVQNLEQLIEMLQKRIPSRRRRLVYSMLIVLASVLLTWATLFLAVPFFRG